MSIRSIPCSRRAFICRLVVPQREKTAVDLRMQGFQPSVHHLRKAGIIRHVGDRDPAFPQLRRRSARGEDLHAEGLQSLGEFDDPLLVRHTDQYPLDFVQMHVLLLFIWILLLVSSSCVESSSG